MKDLQGSAAAPVESAPAQSTALLAAIDRYPLWHPEVIREVEVLERDGEGTPKRGRARVHLALGPAGHDFGFEVSVRVTPGRRVLIKRLPEDPQDRERLEILWLVGPGRIGVELKARLELPRLLPVGGIPDAVAQEFVAVASRALADSSPKASATSS